MTVGKTLAYTSIKFTNSRGEIAARGSHTKSVRRIPTVRCILMPDRYVAMAWKEPKNIVDELSPQSKS